MFLGTRLGSMGAMVAAHCLTCLACAPDTNLIDEGGSLGGESIGPGAGGASLVDPAAGTAGVPVNLAAVLVRFPRPVNAPAGVFTVASAGQPSTVARQVPVDCPDRATTLGSCVRVELVDLLLPSVTYVVSLGAGVVADDGVPITAGVIGQFVTAAEADLRPPGISALTVEPSGPCVRVALQTDEAASVSVLLRSGEVQRIVSAGAGTTQFTVAASLAAFPPGVEVEVVARATDPAGNASESAGVALVVPPGLLPLAITEVLANASGPEPAQEYVELRNLGSGPLDVAGLTIEDAKAADVLPSVIVEAGAYALIVPSGFDPASPLDAAPLAGVPLVRVDARLGSDGLTNGGEVVRLRAAGGTILSSYGGWVDVSSAKWAGKGVHRIPEDACDQAASWTRLPADATPGWGAPP